MPSKPAYAPSQPVAPLSCAAIRTAVWVEPVEAAARFAEEPYAALLLSGEGGWSYLLRDPDAVRLVEADDAFDAPSALSELMPAATPLRDGPPFQGGVLGLAGYELSARLEATAPQARGDWPDLILARYPAFVAFHAGERKALAVGRGATADEAAARAAAALRWLDDARPEEGCNGPLADEVSLGVPDAVHAQAVAETVERIGAGEIFQANLARPWRGRLRQGVSPFDVFIRLARSSRAPYAAWLRLPGRALVSNSPELFLSVRPDGGGLLAETHPIKGTRPRGQNSASDAALAAELLASEKDRAENLMIVDLMRNDLSRVCTPGTVEAPELAGLRSYANVHHLVSRVRGRLRAGASAWDAFLAAFPPGSITGAPKLRAMKVIADYEPPRGPYCGSLFWAGVDGALEASVLIRTIALLEDAAGWRFEARAGGGIVADSEPGAETAETTTKISAILDALTRAP